MVVLLGKGNIYHMRQMQKGGSINIHQVTDDSSSQSCLPPGMAVIPSLGKLQNINPVATSSVAKVVPDMQIGGHLMHSLNNIAFRNTKKSKNIKIKI